MHDDISDLASLQERYTNAGLFEYPERVLFWGLCLDTWYYLNDDLVGELSLGRGPKWRQDDLAGFLWRTFTQFRHAFRTLAELHPVATISYTTVEEMSYGYQRPVSLENRVLFEEQLAAGYESPEDGIQGGSVRWDGRATIRTTEGKLIEHEMPNMGSLKLSTGSLVNPTQRSSGIERFAEWLARVESDFVSLFMCDNSRALAEVRERWRTLRRQDPTLRWMREEIFLDPMVTLVDPPPTAPVDNQALCEPNLSRLRAAVQAWEQETGQAFHATIRLDV
jgi:hypothetical protein